MALRAVVFEPVRSGAFRSLYPLIYVLGVAAAILGTKFDLAAPCCVWRLLLATLALPCAWHARQKRERPNVVTRYF